jgi:hypothetical protein
MPDRPEKFAEEPRSSERRAGRLSRARKRKGIPTRVRIEVRRQNIIRSAVLAETVGPIVFGGTLLALSVLEYDFMLGIGWHPVADPSGALPSVVLLERLPHNPHSSPLLRVQYGFCSRRCQSGVKEPPDHLQGFYLYGIFGLSKPNRESRRADSNRLPLLLLRVMIHASQGFAQVCKYRILKPNWFLCFAPCCTVLRSRWYQRSCISIQHYNI